MISAVEKFTKEAIQIAIKKQVKTLEKGRVERTFTAHLANYISTLLEKNSLEINVDPFYNKHDGATKRLRGKVIELDIAIHAPGSDKNNLMAIELETTNKPKGDDIWKLEGLTSPLEGYGYKLGLYLVIGIDNQAGKILMMDWYKDGKKI